MRYLIVSDMHGNWDAFSVVLKKVRRKRFDAILVLGDLVGYGACPNQVVEAVCGLSGPVHTVRGNHDKAVAGIAEASHFNHAAYQAVRWTAEKLTAGNLRYVRDLPEGPIETEEGVVICHGSPIDEDAYVFSAYDALEIFNARPALITFFGHTHIPSAFIEHEDGIEVTLLRGERGSIEIDENKRYLLNPGSVGQPRDRDPRAAYMTYDSGRRIVRWYRLDYPVGKAQERILKAGLPKVLAERLALGV